MSIFTNYAQYYDLIYKDKDYVRECDVINEIISKFSDIEVKSILDLGCGTGGHANVLAKRGYKVTGVDISQQMLNRAIENRPFQDNPIFYHADIREIGFQETFDSVICMFAVIGYQTENEDLIKVLSNVKRHLKKGGVFIFDCWYGPAVLNIKPTARMKKIVVDDLRYVIRYADPCLYVNTNVVEVNYDLTVVENDIVKDKVTETHSMRYFFLPEIRLLLEMTGLGFVSVFNFEDITQQPSQDTWNIICVAK